MNKCKNGHSYNYIKVDSYGRNYCSMCARIWQRKRSGIAKHLVNFDGKLPSKKRILSVSQRKAIAREFHRGTTVETLAIKYKVHRSTVRRAIWEFTGVPKPTRRSIARFYPN